MIVYQSKDIDKIGARIEWSHFTSGGVEEVHAMLHVEPRCELFEGQVARIQQAEKILLDMEDVQSAISSVMPPIKCLLFRRMMPALSHTSNSHPLMVPK